MATESQRKEEGVHQYPQAFWQTAVLFKLDKTSRELGAIVPLHSMWKVTGFAPDAPKGDIIVAMADQTLLTTT